MKVILLPFAGGNKYSYNNFYKRDDAITLEYPGRGTRIAEPLVTNIYDLVDDVFLQFQRVLKPSEDYIVYGHSLGALIGYLLCQKIEASGLKKPVKLILSGRMAPVHRVSNKLSVMPDNEFWENVWKLGGTPSKIKKYSELLEMFTPILKADFKCVEDFNYEEGQKLTIPIDVSFGTTEKIISDEVEGWRDETTAKVTIRELEGDHFFMYNYKTFFQELFQKID